MLRETALVDPLQRLVAREAVELAAGIEHALD
jgi:hypothetical protein